jgi:hypothetical protein
MEFAAVVRGKKYQFAFLNKNSVLVSSDNVEYILYKNKDWRSADEINYSLLLNLGEKIEEKLQVLL